MQTVVNRKPLFSILDMLNLIFNGKTNRENFRHCKHQFFFLLLSQQLQLPTSQQTRTRVPAPGSHIPLAGSATPRHQAGSCRGRSLCLCYVLATVTVPRQRANSSNVCPPHVDFPYHTSKLTTSVTKFTAL